MNYFTPDKLVITADEEEKQNTVKKNKYNIPAGNISSRLKWFYP